MAANGLHAYLFDLDGTLHFSRPSGIQAFVEYGQNLGLTFEPEAVRRTQRWQHQFWADRPANRRVFDELGELEGWREVTRRQLSLLGVTGPLDDYVLAIHARFEADYRPDSFVPPETRETLTALRERGYVTGLVSNREGALGPAADEYGLADLFEFTLSAGEAGAWKPDPAIFHRAMELAGVAAETAVYVGDNYYADVIGAQAAGLQPILFDPTGLFPDAGCRVIRSLAELLEP